MKKYFLLAFLLLPLFALAQRTKTVQAHHTEKMGRTLSDDERKELIFLTKLNGVSQAVGIDFTNVRKNRKFRKALLRGTGVNKFVSQMYPDVKVRVSAKAPINPNNKFVQHRNDNNFWTCNMEVTVWWEEKTTSEPSSHHEKRTFGIVAGVMHDFQPVKIQASKGLFNYQEWTTNVETVFYGGISLPVGKHFQSLLAFSYKDDLIFSTHTADLAIDMYGGKATIGTYRGSVNPNMGIFYMQGSDNAGSVSLQGVTFGLDFPKTDWKIGLETGGYWFNTDIEMDGYSPDNNDLIDFEDNKFRLIFGLNLKLYF